MTINKINDIQGGNNHDKIKLDTNKDIKQFLGNFRSIGEAKGAIESIIDEVKKSNPVQGAKLENLLFALNKAEMNGLSLGDAINDIDKLMGNDGAAQMAVGNVHSITFDNSATIDTKKIGNTSALA